MLRLFPLQGGRINLEIYDDDGESVIDRNDPPCLLKVNASWEATDLKLTVAKRGAREPRWSEIRFEEPFGQAVCPPIPTSALRGD